MSQILADTRGARKLVVTPHALPDWASSGIDDLFDVRRTDADPAACAHATAMLTSGPEPVGRALLEQLPALRYICCLGSGYEGIDIACARERGIVVSNSAMVTAQDVADQMVAIVLALQCRIPALDADIRAGRWHKPIRTSLRERRVGIVGFGAIGQAVAARIAPFGPEIRWTGPRPKDTPYGYSPDLIALAGWADMLLVTARADAGNVGLIGDAVFNALGPDGIVANVSRGSIVDEDALIAALKAGRLGGAALDVFHDEPTPPDRWADVPNTVLSPHVGGYATGVRRGIRQLVRSNLIRHFAGEAPVGIVT